MATYAELYDLRSNSAILNRVTVAVAKKAQALLDGTPSAAQVTWAMDALASPQQKAQILFNYVLAKNSDLTTAQIQAASDAAIQGQINAAVDALINGGA